MRIAVRDGLLVEKISRSLEPLDDCSVGGKDLLAGQPIWRIGGEAPGLVHRAEYRKPICPAGLIVFGAVAGRGMNHSSAVGDTDIIREHDWTDTLDEWVT